MRSQRKPLYETLLKVKEELMLLGFISLLLNVLQGPMGRWCVNPDIMRHLLPCKTPPRDTEHLGDAVFAGATRRLLAGGGDSEDYCMEKGKVSLLSAEAIHQLHIFIFVLAVTHFVLSATTVLLGIVQTRNGQHWETKIQEKDADVSQMIKHVQEFKFIQDHFRGHRKRWKTVGWMV
ncbi:hypothetical protein ACQ4PT_064204 [Festuca glaucescens]